MRLLSPELAELRALEPVEPPHVTVPADSLPPSPDVLLLFRVEALRHGDLLASSRVGVIRRR